MLKDKMIEWGKYCFAYCGPEVCNCDKAQKGKEMLQRHRDQINTLNKAELMELEHLNGN